MTNYCFYIRVSKRGTQINGINAQLNGLESFVETTNASCSAIFVEEMSGANDNRPALQKALEYCKESGATLLVYRLDRLSRKVSFIANLLDRGIKFKVSTMPEADTFQLGIYSCLNQQERLLISLRTKEALQIVKKNGKMLGQAKLNKKRADDSDKLVIPVVMTLLSQSLTQKSIANRLNDDGFKTARGLAWTHQKVSRLIQKHSLH